MEKVTITLKKENWKTLKELELKKDFKTHDEAIEFLFKKSRITTSFHGSTSTAQHDKKKTKTEIKE